MSYERQNNGINKKDCYYYYYSTCSKGESCHFRHEPFARGNEQMCIQWLKGKCFKPHCNFKHLEIKKDRSSIPCFHESQPGGCLKMHCPFLHAKKECSQKGHKSAFKTPRLDNYALQGIHPSALSATGQKNFRKDPSKKLSPLRLAKTLSDYSNFTTTLLTLYEKFKFDPTVIKKIAAENDAVFVIEDEAIILKPNIKMCQNYVSSEGCNYVIDSSLACQSLHLCKDFVYETCKNANCSLGHNLDTNQNKLVLDLFKLSWISPDVILKLFRMIVFKAKLSKDQLCFCAEYGAGNCQKIKCNSLHLCMKYLATLCNDNKNCLLSHDLVNKETINLLELHGLNPNKEGNDVRHTLLSCPLVKKNIDDLISKELEAKKNLVKTLWSHDYEGNVQVEEICYNSVENYCPLESSGCSKLHSKYHYHWQVLSNLNNKNLWVNLHYDQVFALEKAYCDPSVVKVALPPLDTSAIQSSCRELISLLKGNSKWEVDFDGMELVLSKGNCVLKLRRLCTELTIHSTSKACIFSWYFLDKNNEWIEYGNLDSTKKDNLKANVNSALIEIHLKKNANALLQFNNQSFNYTLDCHKMIQTNSKTKVSRTVRRRPMPHLKDVPKQHSLLDIPDHWDLMQPEERVKRVKLLPTSDEYQTIDQFMKKQGGNYYIESMERVQTLYYWRAFQNKIDEMKVLYGNDKSANVQRLFHGTNPDTVPKICNENFDWRLHGSNVGQAYGRGTYFSPLASTSYKYTKQDSSGRRYMFVAKVAVGSITQGNNSMVRPPINPLTNLSYDSTADSQNSPSIIVKYDKQEYFPEYILTLK